MSGAVMQRERVVLITGGARGIGRAIAQALAAEGAAVWVTSRGAPVPSAVHRSSAGEIRAVGLDVTDEQSVRTLFTAIDQVYGRLDVLINNAGVGVFRPFEALTAADMRSVLDTNVLGAFLCSREAYIRMKRHGGGRIVNIGSIAGAVPLAENAAYAASKFALRGLSQVLNEEAKASQVRVTHVTLGAVYTEIWRDREGFCEEDMLSLSDVATAICDVLRHPLHVRVDDLALLPPKGIL